MSCRNGPVPADPHLPIRWLETCWNTTPAAARARVAFGEKRGDLACPPNPGRLDRFHRGSRAALICALLALSPLHEIK